MQTGQINRRRDSLGLSEESHGGPGSCELHMPMPRHMPMHMHMHTDMHTEMHTDVHGH